MTPEISAAAYTVDRTAQAEAKAVAMEVGGGNIQTINQMYMTPNPQTGAMDVPDVRGEAGMSTNTLDVGGFQVSPLMLGAAALALVLLMRK
jgi:hypothetical protein